MSPRPGSNKEMPNLPEYDLDDAITEIWSSLSYAAYHMAYVRTYSESAAVRTPKPSLESIEDQTTREHALTDIVVCRAHLASFFWNLDHFFEALQIAVKCGKKEYPDSNYFEQYQEQLGRIERSTTFIEIKDYRNWSHRIPGIIGCNWDAGGNFLHHFLPTISGHSPKENVDLNLLLRQYFEFAANVWFDFIPQKLHDKYPRNFRFPVTVPYLFTGDIPEGVKSMLQCEVLVQRQEPDQASI